MHVFDEKKPEFPFFVLPIFGYCRPSQAARLGTGAPRPALVRRCCGNHSVIIYTRFVLGGPVGLSFRRFYFLICSSSDYEKIITVFSSSLISETPFRSLTPARAHLNPKMVSFLKKFFFSAKYFGACSLESMLLKVLSFFVQMRETEYPQWL